MMMSSILICNTVFSYINFCPHYPSSPYLPFLFQTPSSIPPAAGVEVGADKRREGERDGIALWLNSYINISILICNTVFSYINFCPHYPSSPYLPFLFQTPSSIPPAAGVEVGADKRREGERDGIALWLNSYINISILICNTVFSYINSCPHYPSSPYLPFLFQTPSSIPPAAGVEVGADKRREGERDGIALWLNSHVFKTKWRKIYPTH